MQNRHHVVNENLIIEMASEFHYGLDYLCSKSTAFFAITLI